MIKKSKRCLVLLMSCSMIVGCYSPTTFAESEVSSDAKTQSESKTESKVEAQVKAEVEAAIKEAEEDVLKEKKESDAVKKAAAATEELMKSRASLSGEELTASKAGDEGDPVTEPAKEAKEVAITTGGEKIVIRNSQGEIVAPTTFSEDENIVNYSLVRGDSYTVMAENAALYDLQTSDFSNITDNKDGKFTIGDNDETASFGITTSLREGDVWALGGEFYKGNFDSFAAFKEAVTKGEIVGLSTTGSLEVKEEDEELLKGCTLYIGNSRDLETLGPQRLDLLGNIHLKAIVIEEEAKKSSEEPTSTYALSQMITPKIGLNNGSTLTIDEDITSEKNGIMFGQVGNGTEKIPNISAKNIDVNFLEIVGLSLKVTDNINVDNGYFMNQSCDIIVGGDVNFQKGAFATFAGDVTIKGSVKGDTFGLIAGKMELTSNLELTNYSAILLNSTLLVGGNITGKSLEVDGKLQLGTKEAPTEYTGENSLTVEQELIVAEEGTIYATGNVTAGRVALSDSSTLNAKAVTADRVTTYNQARLDTNDMECNTSYFSSSEPLYVNNLTCQNVYIKAGNVKAENMNVTGDLTVYSYGIIDGNILNVDGTFVADYEAEINTTKFTVNGEVLCINATIKSDQFQAKSTVKSTGTTIKVKEFQAAELISDYGTLTATNCKVDGNVNCSDSQAMDVSKLEVKGDITLSDNAVISCEKFAPEGNIKLLSYAEVSCKNFVAYNDFIGSGGAKVRSNIFTAEKNATLKDTDLYVKDIHIKGDLISDEDTEIEGTNLVVEGNVTCDDNPDFYIENITIEKNLDITDSAYLNTNSLAVGGDVNSSNDCYMHVRTRFWANGNVNIGFYSTIRVNEDSDSKTTASFYCNNLKLVNGSLEIKGNASVENIVSKQSSVYFGNPELYTKSEEQGQLTVRDGSASSISVESSSFSAKKIKVLGSEITVGDLLATGYVYSVDGKDVTGLNTSELTGSISVESLRNEITTPKPITGRTMKVTAGAIEGTLSSPFDVSESYWGMSTDNGKTYEEISSESPWSLDLPKDLIPGIYKFMCYAGSSSKASEITTVKVLPETVIGVKAAASGNAATVSWTGLNYGDNCEVGYEVAVKDSAGNLITTKDTKATSITVKNLDESEKYSFSVSAYVSDNGETLSGNGSKAVSVVTSASSKTTSVTTENEKTTEALSVEKPSTPTCGKLIAGSKKITIKWKKAKRATGYEIYRATSKNGTYRKVKTTTAKQWTNKKLKSKKKYYYKVRSYRVVNGKKYYSKFSKVKSSKAK